MPKNDELQTKLDRLFNSSKSLEHLKNILIMNFRDLLEFTGMPLEEFNPVLQKISELQNIINSEEISQGYIKAQAFEITKDLKFGKGNNDLKQAFYLKVIEHAENAINSNMQNKLENERASTLRNEASTKLETLIQLRDSIRRDYAGGKAKSNSNKRASFTPSREGAIQDGKRNQQVRTIEKSIQRAIREIDRAWQNNPPERAKEIENEQLSSVLSTLEGVKKGISKEKSLSKTSLYDIIKKAQSEIRETYGLETQNALKGEKENKSSQRKSNRK